MRIEKKLQQLLDQRKSNGLLRSLRIIPGNISDFSSNDYLGFSRKGILHSAIKNLKENPPNLPAFRPITIRTSNQEYGSGGSRLLAGNNKLVEDTEKELAVFFQSESALIFNSGYDANLGIFSCVPQKGDLVFYDELVHASIHDGMRLSHAKCFKFRHNDINDLRKKTGLQDLKGKNVFVAVESVYSMDGDLAPLKELASYCEENNFALVVDEAHAAGVFGPHGKGLCVEYGIEKKCFMRLYTFSKAFGAHGAAICGSSTLSNYVINFARPFIFSTALPHESIIAIKTAIHLAGQTEEKTKLRENISLFNKLFSGFPGRKESFSPIQTIIIPGNVKVQRISEMLFEKGFDVRAVKSPTVKAGSERLRISLHSFNTSEEINRLFVELSAAMSLTI